MSTAQELVLAVLGMGLVPCLGGAQAVVVRHEVQAVVIPLASVRDSGWVRTNPDLEPGRWSWTAELRANSAAELQVLGPEVADSAARIRVGSGPWIRLQPRVWNGVSTLGAGKRDIAIEYSAAASVASPGPPHIRVRVH